MGSALGSVAHTAAPLEAVAFTEYDSELCTYITVLTAATLRQAVAGSGGQASHVALRIASARAQAWTAFANGSMVGAGWETSHGGGDATITLNLDLSAFAAGGGSDGVVLALLSTSLGIDNGGGVNNGPTPDTFHSTAVKGVTSRAARAVLLGGVDITLGGDAAGNGWTQVAGAHGEALEVYTPAGGSKVSWQPAAGPSVAPMSWLRTAFTAPDAVFRAAPDVELNATLNVDVLGLSRGRLFVNGMDLGRYWSKACGSDLCQRYYSVPFDLLQRGAGANSLVVLDEMGAANLSAVGLAVSLNTAESCAAQVQVSAAALSPCGINGTTFHLAAGGMLQLSGAPSLCLGIFNEHGPVSDSPQVGVVPCNASDSRQQWSLPAQGVVDTVTNKHYGASTCLDVDGQSTAYGALVEMWACDGGSNQRFRWDASTGQLEEPVSHLCIGVCN